MKKIEQPYFVSTQFNFFKLTLNSTVIYYCFHKHKKKNEK